MRDFLENLPRLLTTAFGYLNHLLMAACDGVGKGILRGFAAFGAAQHCASVDFTHSSSSIERDSIRMANGALHEVNTRDNGIPNARPPKAASPTTGPARSAGGSADQAWHAAEDEGQDGLAGRATGQVQLGLGPHLDDPHSEPDQAQPQRVELGGAAQGSVRVAHGMAAEGVRQDGRRGTGVRRLHISP